MGGQSDPEGREKVERCDSCGQVLSPASLRYRVRIQTWADFDGSLPDCSESDLAAALEDAAQKTAGLPEELIEEEVYKGFAFVICRRCKEIFCANPLNRPLDDLRLA
jgi:hypothetical protein